MVWCGVVWCGVVWCGMVWCGVLWCIEVSREGCVGALSHEAGGEIWVAAGGACRWRNNTTGTRAHNIDGDVSCET